MTTIGELDETVDQYTVKWTIRDFFSLSADEGEEFYSPSFNFADERWRLVMYPNSSTEDESEGNVDIYLERESSGLPMEMNFHVSLLTSENMLCGEYHFAHNFDEQSEYGMSFIERSYLFERESELVPSGHLTWVCILEHPDGSTIDNERDNSASGSTAKSKILEDLKQLLQSQEHCDVVILVKGKEFPAHKNILTARSPVFAAEFRNDMKEKKTNAIHVEDLDPAIFPKFLQYLYCEDLDNLSAENVFGLFTAADKYEVMDLRSKCLKFITKNLSVDTFCDTMTIAVCHSEDELIHLATDFFVENAKKIIATVEWQTFVAKNPTQSNELFMEFVASVKR